MELRAFRQQDFKTLSSWFRTEADVVQWGGPLLSFPLTESQLEAMLSDTLRDPPLRKCWMADDRGEIVGHAQLAFDWRNGNATLGRVAISPQHRGSRLAVPMLQLVLREAFSISNIYRVELYVSSLNEPAFGHMKLWVSIWKGQEEKLLW